MSEHHLPPHRYYYLHNFQRALKWVSDRYGDLLEFEEQEFIARFAELPQTSQALLVRLLMRRGPWFLADKLAYEEIPDAGIASEPLLANGWLSHSEAMSVEELFALHTKAELQALFAAVPLPRDMRKQDMLQTLVPLFETPQPYVRWSPTSGRVVWRVMIGELCDRVRLMFFGNLHQDWSEFVLADLGIFQYEQVPFDARSRAFQSRADLDGYLELHACRQAFDAQADIRVTLHQVVQFQSSNPWLVSRRAKLLLHMGLAFERVQDWEHAEQAYANSSYPGARHRCIRVYERAERFDDSLNLALVALAEPETEEERQRVARMMPRLYKKTGRRPAEVDNTPVPSMAAIRMDTQLDPAVPPLSVEHVLRDHWHTEAAPVFYVENTLINSLFGLLCWPAIFEPLPGAFFHPFQVGPADLGAPDFVQRRAALFDACLAELDDGRYQDTILERFALKHGVQSPFVFWGALSEPLITLALQCISAQHLKLFFTRLLSDVKANRSGLPDLVRFWPKERRYEFVEVKAPGDKLQDNQIRWLQYCMSHEIPVRVCHVSWRESAPNPVRPDLPTDGLVL